MTLGNNSADMQLQWEPKSLEIRTRSVEMALQPLVMKVIFVVLLIFCFEDVFIKYYIKSSYTLKQFSMSEGSVVT